MLIKRTIYNGIKKTVFGEQKVIILYGPRQAGKTTLINQLTTELPADATLSFTGDDLRTQEIFSQPILHNLKTIIGKKKFLIIDEAQRIENIGLTLKLLHDNLPVQIIASGSSSFDLANKINEPLTGRTKTFFLHPLSWKEAKEGLSVNPPPTEIERLEQYLRYGMYPKVITVTDNQSRQDYLLDFINSYLYRDILNFEQIRKPKKVIDLLSLLALQIGMEVSIEELSHSLKLAKPIVEKYLDVLEKMFLIYNLRGFSRNLRSEITKTSKYYFYDLGIRNALIRNFNPLNIRADKGNLFENYAVMERIKSLSNNNKFANFYFWRTYDQKEIDLIEEREGELKAFEFKFSPEAKKKPLALSLFTKTYIHSKAMFITPNNINNFLYSSA